MTCLGLIGLVSLVSLNIEKHSLPSQNPLVLGLLSVFIYSITCLNKSTASSYFSVRPPKSHHPEFADERAFSACINFSAS